ncbi:hypothetical protein PN499_18515 [Kamptonema animale CS-326]|uniref:hypothetical protein n=1 Tax=Kamptonema animale TaxID=92934 RepID=UPI00232D5DAE|nr:hypothetical protein [Kamptonema animale]MDB9513191.1 hypothetical protein [Kamptonema animale CS-326]
MVVTSKTVRERVTAFGRHTILIQTSAMYGIWDWLQVVIKFCSRKRFMHGIGYRQEMAGNRA